MPRRTVLVTGASGGIGKAVAVEFAKKGYNMAISCVHREEQLMQTQKEIRSFQVPYLTYKGDMRDMVCCEELFLKIKKIFGGVNVLMNNAGTSCIGPLQDMAPAGWERVLRTNLASIFNYCKLTVPCMISQKQGKIVNISSVWSIVSTSCETAYSATKGGINALTRVLAKELVPSNIRVNAIACGAINTKMNQWMDEDDLIALMDKIPSGRFGRAEEVTNLAYHLSYKESYLTRRIIGLDEGWT